MTGLPDRAVICRQCRVVLPRGHICEVASHQILQLDVEADRAALAIDVHGEDDTEERRRARRTYWLIAGGAIVLLLAGSIAGIAAGSTLGYVAAACVLVGASSAFAFAPADASAVVSSFDDEWIGAVALPPAHDTPVVGSVRGDAGQNDPITGAQCVAWCVELHRYGATPTSLSVSDGWSAGFEIETNDGLVIEVPAGPLRARDTPVHLTYEQTRPRAIAPNFKSSTVPRQWETPERDHWPPAVAVPLRRAFALAEHIDRLGANRPTLFPCDELRVLIVRPGDVVELHGTHEPCEDPGAGGYRDAAGRRRRSVGIPVLRSVRSPG